MEDVSILYVGIRSDLTQRVLSLPIVHDRIRIKNSFLFSNESIHEWYKAQYNANAATKILLNSD